MSYWNFCNVSDHRCKNNDHHKTNYILLLLPPLSALTACAGMVIWALLSVSTDVKLARSWALVGNTISIELVVSTIWALITERVIKQGGALLSDYSNIWLTNILPSHKYGCAGVIDSTSEIDTIPLSIPEKICTTRVNCLQLLPPNLVSLIQDIVEHICKTLYKASGTYLCCILG